ncbi:MAG TPA: nucleotide exchange factor GrpE [Burkholderiales bacterium]|jgi:molecular chaperone GrpE|nr:nucleotide exchange factor GrpE [Burkholderiales bacterium]
MADPISPSENNDGAASGAQAADEGKSLDQLLAEAQAKIDEQRNAWLRALADAENARKRTQAEIAQVRRFAVERIVEDLLPVVDSLEAALAAAPAAGDDPLRSGVELTLKLLRNAFERAGVSEIAPSAGERFDPHRHQAMAAVESDAEPNTVVSVMQKGYLLHDRVVRAALVTVAKSQPANDPAQA